MKKRREKNKRKRNNKRKERRKKRKKKEKKRKRNKKKRNRKKEYVRIHLPTCISYDGICINFLYLHMFNYNIISSVCNTSLAFTV